MNAWKSDDFATVYSCTRETGCKTPRAIQLGILTAGGKSMQAQGVTPAYCQLAREGPWFSRRAAQSASRNQLEPLHVESLLMAAGPKSVSDETTSRVSPSPSTAQPRCIRVAGASRIGRCPTSNAIHSSAETSLERDTHASWSDAPNDT